MAQFNVNDHPHRRWNPLMGEWLLVSPHRAKRPWSGHIEDIPPSNLPTHDPKCYLCPGNERAGGIKNPDYENTFVFVNDFSALLADTPHEGGFEAVNGLVREKPETGECRVICFSPKHNLTPAEMSEAELRTVVDLWCEQFEDLASRDDIQTVTIFENRGEMMGCSNPHPHGQIWSNRCIPTIQSKEVKNQAAYFETYQQPLLMDYLEWELEQKTRIILENKSFVVLVPHWAIWPFETLIMPRRPMQNILELSEKEQDDWARILKLLLVRYDNLFEVSFPYSMGIHQAPCDAKNYPELVWHQHFFPPLLRSATVRKFQVGYEMSGEPQRDITPEQAAERLRALSSKHYLLR